MVDASATGVGSVLVQAENKGQMQVISFISRIFNESDQKFAVIFIELTAIDCAVEIYEFLIIGSMHAITIFAEYKPILSLFFQKSIIYHQFFTYKSFFTR